VVTTSAEKILFLHTDISRLHHETRRNLKGPEDPVRAIYQFMIQASPKTEFWLPAFNYTFGTTKIFDLENDPCEVGVLNEALRKLANFKRSPVPIFSIIRNAHLPMFDLTKEVNPFGMFSEFAELRARNGSIVFFGATIHNLTFIHYIEEVLEVSYRYPKRITGTIIQNKTSTPISVKFRARPRNLQLEYDWVKIHANLRLANLPKDECSLGKYELYECEPLSQYLLEKLSADQFWLLKKECRVEVESRLMKLGREFREEDFEGTELLD
jgi:aminoglycoside N3'-acetyltransferase